MTEMMSGVENAVSAENPDRDECSDGLDEQLVEQLIQRARPVGCS